MKTDSLIAALSADMQGPRRPLERLAVMILLPVAIVLVIAVMLSLGLRAGFFTPAILAMTGMKWSISVPLAVTGLILALKLARPAQYARKYAVLALLPALMLLAMICVDFGRFGFEGWQARMIGHYGRECLVFVPLFSLLPFAAMIYILRQGAVMRPQLAALAASLTATGIGASAYELHCVDDSPLFMGLWYVSGLLMIVALGQIIAARLLRW